MKEVPSKEELFRLHITEKLKIDTIAEKFNVSKSTITRWFKKYGIPSKNSDGNDYDKLVGKYVPELEDYTVLRKLYIEDGKSFQDIGDMFGKSYEYVRYKALKLGIVPREANSTRWGKVDKKNKETIITYDELYDLFVNKNKDKKEIAKIYGLSAKEIGRRLTKFKIYKTLRKKNLFLEKIPNEIKNEDLIADLYYGELLSCKQIAEKFSISEHYVKKLMKFYNIKLRTQKESAKILSGEKSPHWKGVSYTLYDKIRAYSRDNLHKKAKERDKNTCQLCGKTEGLQVHHKKPLWKIYYEILSEHPEYNQYDNIEELKDIMINDERINDLNNLITYCEECHLFKIHGYTHKQVEALKDRRRLKHFR